MAIKIEVIKEDKIGTQVAYYFRIPPESKLPGADNPNKQPAGKALKGQELADFRVGTILEILVDYPFTNLQLLSLEEKQALFEAEWDAMQADAIRKYTDRYRLVGDYLEDGTWVNDDTLPGNAGGQP